MVYLLLASFLSNGLFGFVINVASANGKTVSKDLSGLDVSRKLNQTTTRLMQKITDTSQAKDPWNQGAGAVTVFIEGAVALATIPIQLIGITTGFVTTLLGLFGIPVWVSNLVNMLIGVLTVWFLINFRRGVESG